MSSDFQQINDYNFNIDSFVQGNNGAVLRFNVRRKGNIVPIDNATVNVAIKRGNDLITKNATIISAPGGICEVILTRADLATAGTYYLQPTIIFPDDDEFSGDVQKFVVSGKLTGAPTNPGNGGTNPVFTVRDSAINGNIIVNGAETVVYDDTGKVDKIAGKGLSTNDYDNTEKSEVAKVKDKADKTYVDTAIGLKADKTYVDTQLSDKVTQASLNTTNANVTANTSAITLKADKTYVDTQLADKASQTALNTTNANVAANTAAIASHTTSINANTTAIAGKADKTYVDGELGKKANQTDLTAQSSRIDNIVANAGAGNTEIVDIRVGVDGVTYASAGESIREQMKKEIDKRAAISDVLWLSNNAIDQSKVLSGQYASGTNGTLQTNANYAVSDYIEVTTGDKVYGYVAPNTATFPAVLYDKNKNFVSVATSLPDYAGDTTTRRWSGTIPGGVKYIRSNIPVGNITSAMLRVNVTYSTTAPFVAYDVPRYQATLQSITNSKIISPSTTTFLLPTKNKFDFTKSVSGYIGTNTGQIYASSSYKTSDFIAVDPNTDYVISPKVKQFLAYDANKTAIVETFVGSQTPGDYTFNSGTNIKYIRFAYYINDEKTCQLAPGTSFSSFEPFGYVADAQVFGNQKLPLWNKTLYNFGDSIAAGDGNSGVGYAELLTGRIGVKVVDYAIGGTTLSYTEGQVKGSIQTAIDNASTVVPDIVLLEGGSNDNDISVPVGTMSDTYDFSGTWGTTTYASALETSLYKLVTKYQGAQIVFICTHQQGRHGLFVQYRDMALAICKKWSIPVVDLFSEGGLNTNIDSYKTAYTNNADGTHPNALGYNKFYVPKIAAKLLTLV